MKRSVKVIFCMLFLTLLLAVSCQSPQTGENEVAAVENELVGVWKLAGVTLADPEAQAITDPQPGYGFISNKYASFTGITGPRSELPENPTDTQLAAAYNSFSATFSTYEVEGNTVKTHPVVSKDPNVKPSDFMVWEYRFEGNSVFMTAKESQDGPIENPYTLEFTRLE